MELRLSTRVLAVSISIAGIVWDSRLVTDVKWVLLVPSTSSVFASKVAKAPVVPPSSSLSLLLSSLLSGLPLTFATNYW
jgi:hypothetical protein